MITWGDCSGVKFGTLCMARCYVLWLVHIYIHKHLLLFQIHLNFLWEFWFASLSPLLLWTIVVWSDEKGCQVRTSKGLERDNMEPTHWTFLDPLAWWFLPCLVIKLWNVSELALGWREDTLAHGMCAWECVCVRVWTRTRQRARAPKGSYTPLPSKPLISNLGGGFWWYVIKLVISGGKWVANF